MLLYSSISGFLAFSLIFHNLKVLAAETVLSTSGDDGWEGLAPVVVYPDPTGIINKYVNNYHPALTTTNDQASSTATEVWVGSNTHELGVCALCLPVLPDYAIIGHILGNG